ncbi:cytochrome P450 6B4-like [Bicyclus anynana]|uniref:unspecific monooxygenase n=1 Tax=Bicyclus anynana TaxID=110368 RepID=A0A6J1NK68_BICAN|nr:cytochrome P450 6B4-like [Bicyclus anynana]
MAIYLIFLFVIAVLYFSYYLLLKNQNYWKIRNVPYARPLPLFGNYKESLLLKKHITLVMRDMCQQFPNEPYFGSFYGTTPALVVQDPNLLKLIMSKEFYFCNGREASDYYGRETIAKNLFLAHGDEWKVLRANLTPLFSSVKLKNMFYLIKNSSDAMEELLAEEVKMNPSIDIKCLLSRYTIDCITACAFGINSDTMNKNAHKNPFKIMGEKIFDTSDYQALKNICRSMWPATFYALGYKVFKKDICSFFIDLMSEVFKKREETKMSKNDFVDLIMAWKRNNHISGDSMSNLKTGDKKKIDIDVSNDLLIAQCVLFFAAGFETTSTTTSFLLYELAKDKIAQEKLIAEVDEYFAKHDAVEYECTNMMPYTEACLEESLRLHPVLGFLTREVMDDYTLPTGYHCKKGDRIHIPLYHIHHSPDHFPEPEAFRPERFLGDEKKNIKPFTYMPFGEGPRTCIGMRFAKMPMYAGLLKIFKNYRVELADNMPHKITMDPKATVTQHIGGIHLKFIPREA